MPDNNKQKALNALRQMKNYRDPKKEGYESNADLARRLGIKSSGTVKLARQNLIFAIDYEIDIDKSIVYAWRYSGDKRFAKIGQCSKGGILRERMQTTFHPTDDIFLIGIKEYSDAKEIRREEKRILEELGRTRCGREWVCINENFKKLINKEFTLIKKIVK